MSDLTPRWPQIDLDVLRSIERRILWLSVRMVDHANKRKVEGIKTGGHQASSASMVSIMTALCFGHLSGEDKIAVKPHAAPVHHAIQYLIGNLDRKYLTRLRALGGLQAYPSRTKDPDVFDFSTGSVGLGAVAPLFSAAVRRYVDAHFDGQLPGRFIAIAGDAELDEGNVWEAISDPEMTGLGNVTMVIDFNRQSLDRVVPDIRIARLSGFFSSAGWHVQHAKYGALLERTFARPHGESLRRYLDDMSNEEYQSMFSVAGSALRERFLANADNKLKEFMRQYSDGELGPLIQDLGGHDISVLLDRFRRSDDVVDRPTVIFAYTIKGWGLPVAGDPLNHSALLSVEDISYLRQSVNLDEAGEWDRFAPDTPEGQVCEEAGRRVRPRPRQARPTIPVPTSSGGASASGAISTQEAFGRILVGLAHDEQLSSRLVTASPDVAISTSLGGWINSRGVFSVVEKPDFYGEGRLLRWAPSKEGQHIELGISEMNLFMLLGQLGLAYEHHGEILLPIGTVYDPFILRGLDALVYSLYSGSRFVIVGTPSGVTLAPEGGAHQSSITPSVGLELPCLAASEPTYALAADWLICDALSRLLAPDGESHYMRLSTRPVDQGPFAAALNRLGEQRLREDVLKGGYRLREPKPGRYPLVIVAAGPVMPEVLLAADVLEDEGLSVTVLDVTSSDRLYRSWHDSLVTAVRSAQIPENCSHLVGLLTPIERRAPIVTVHDAASHSMAWIGIVLGQHVFPVGVDSFGESGSIPDLYGRFGLSTDAIVNVGLIAVA